MSNFTLWDIKRLEKIERNSQMENYKESSLNSIIENVKEKGTECQNLVTRYLKELSGKDNESRIDIFDECLSEEDGIYDSLVQMHRETGTDYILVKGLASMGEGLNVRFTSPIMRYFTGTHVKLSKVCPEQNCIEFNVAKSRSVLGKGSRKISTGNKAVSAHFCLPVLIANKFSDVEIVAKVSVEDNDDATITLTVYFTKLDKVLTPYTVQEVTAVMPATQEPAQPFSIERLEALVRELNALVTAIQETGGAQKLTLNVEEGYIAYTYMHVVSGGGRPVDSAT